MKVVLELQDQPSNVRKVTVRHDIVIGRGSDCNLRLSAPQVSRRHCFLRVGREGVSVTDLDSSNGTYVDGKRIVAGQRCALKDGDFLALGSVRFLVHLQQDAVVSEVLRSSTTKKNGAAAEGQSSRGAAVQEHSSAVIAGGLTSAAEALNFSVEHGGAAIEPHELTRDSADNQFDVETVTGPTTGTMTDSMDSRMEIVDFGRRLAAQESAGLNRAQAAPVKPFAVPRSDDRNLVAENRTEEEAVAEVEDVEEIFSYFDVEAADQDEFVVAESPVSGPSASEMVDDVELVVDAEVLDDVELLDEDEEVVDAVGVAEIIEVEDEEFGIVETIDGVEFAESAGGGVAEEVEDDVNELAELAMDDESDANWFDDSSNGPALTDDDDDDLQKFLKGL